MAVVLLGVAFIVCGGCIMLLLCFAVLYVLSSFAITPLGKRELVVLRSCVLNVMSLLSFFDSYSWNHWFVCSMCVCLN